jgi:DNA-binding response OmpR family regulator
MNDENLLNANILMLDDEEGELGLLEAVLTRSGYKHLRCLSDATDILDEIADFQPDLLILDLHMANIDGFQVLDLIRASIPREAGFPILVLTGGGTHDDIRKALEGGATDLLRKPCEISELTIRIRNLLHTRFLQLEIFRHNHTLEEKVAERTCELERVLAELKATQHQNVQQERLHAFGEMAAGVVHDFKNALMSVIGYSELLLNDPGLLGNEAIVRKYLKIMNTAGHDATNVIGRLRDFYRSREETDLFEPIDLNKII